ncbi:MAG: hypothetical protein QXF24_09760, partial [Thermoproteota archaeon]
MRRWWASIACVMIASVTVRLVPSAPNGLPYGFDVYDVVSRIRTAMSTGKFGESMPQGPLLYSLLCELVILGGLKPETVLSVVAPALLSLSVIPAILYAKKSLDDEFAAIAAGILASSTNMIVHQTGGTVVPEGLGITFAGFFLSLFIKTKWKDRKNALLISIAALGTLASHHLTTFNVILGIIVASLFTAVAAAKKGKIGSEARKIVLLSIPLASAAVLIWAFAAPQHTFEVISLTLKEANGLTLAGGASLATFAVAAMGRAIWRPKARSRAAGKPLLFAIGTFFSSLSIPLIFHWAVVMDSGTLRA